MLILRDKGVVVKVVIGFVGGSLDDYVSFGDSENRTPDGEVVFGRYRGGNSGTVRSTFSVSNDGCG